MSPTFNYTERLRIYQKDVSVRVQELADGAKEVQMRADLSSYDFPFDAQARVTANTSSSSWVLFEGRVRDLLTPRRNRVIDVEDWHSVQFRLRVSEMGSGKLLGTTARFKLDAVDEDSSGLLTVGKGQTGELPYKLELSWHSSPTLVISSALWDERHQLRENVIFRSIMLPDVLRQVLRFAVVDAGMYEDGTSESNWFGDWLEWMDSFEGLEGFSDSLQDLGEDTEAQLAWIEDAISAFASSPVNQFVDKLTNSLNGTMT